MYPPKCPTWALSVTLTLQQMRLFLMRLQRPRRNSGCKEPSTLSPGPVFSLVFYFSFPAFFALQFHVASASSLWGSAPGSGTSHRHPELTLCPFPLTVHSVSPSATTHPLSTSPEISQFCSGQLICLQPSNSFFRSLSKNAGWQLHADEVKTLLLLTDQRNPVPTLRQTRGIPSPPFGRPRTPL